MDMVTSALIAQINTTANSPPMETGFTSVPAATAAATAVTTGAVVLLTTNIVSLNKNTISNAVYEYRFLLPPYIVIFFLSISGNLLVISTLSCNRRLRTVTNVYLMNLAVSDFLLGVFCMPFTLIGQIFRSFLFGEALCKFISFIQAVTVAVDVWTLVAISLERYCAICRPLSSRRWQTLHHAYRMIALVWLAALLVNLPILLVSTLRPMKGNAYKCREIWVSIEMERSFNLALDVILLLIPFCAMTCAYAAVVAKLWKGMRWEMEHNSNLQNLAGRGHSRGGRDCVKCHQQTNLSNKKTRLASRRGKRDNTDIMEETAFSKRRMCCGGRAGCGAGRSGCLHELDFRHAIRSTHMNKSIKSKRKVIKMLCVIIIGFFICWVPLHTINTLYLFYPREVYQVVGARGVMCFQLLAYCSACTNPLAYCFMNNKFRRAFVVHIKSSLLFRCCFPKRTASLDRRLPPPSSQEVTVAVARSTHSRRTDVERAVSEEYV